MRTVVEVIAVSMATYMADNRFIDTKGFSEPRFANLGELA